MKLLSLLPSFAFLSLLCARVEAQTTAIPPRITQAVDEKNLVVLRGNVHPLARPEFDQGKVGEGQPLRRMLLLLQRSAEQESALEKLLEDQQSKSSANYHGWLTPAQFGQQFGPADADIQTVTNWLQSHGFQINHVTDGRTVIEFSGDAAQVRSAFHTEIHKYVVNGETHLANASDPQIPGALASAISGVVSLHDFRKQPTYRLAGTARSSKTTGAVQQPRPEYTFDCVDFLTSIFGAFSGRSGSCYPLGPYDFATIYNVLPLWNAATPIDGTGQTIAIVGRTNINVQDVSDFRTLFGLPTNSPQVILDGPDPGLVDGDETEADLDVEWSGAVAKGATIKLVVSQSTETTDGVDLSALYIVDHNLAPVMSESYGQCEFNLGAAGNIFHNNLWQQAAAQGITAFVSTGDNGSAGCDFLQMSELQPAQYGLEVSGLASTPYNTAVGGTDFSDYFNLSTYWNATSNPTTQESAQGYIPETAWNDSCTNAIFELPNFPMSTNPETNCNNTGAPQLIVINGASGGKSGCIAPSATTVASCAGAYPKPSWQAAPGVPNDGARDLPDVSLFASNGFQNTFYMMCQTDLVFGSPCSLADFVGVGGTSASTPAFAGLLALVNQRTGERQGNANYVLYALAAKQSAANCNSSTGPASTCVFNDITSGTIAMPCLTGSPNCATTNPNDQYGILSGYSAGTGYDLATGLGSVNAANLVNNWSSASRAPSSATLVLNGGNAVNITHGTPVSVAVSVSPASPQPTGSVALLATQGNQSLGLNNYTLSNGTASGTTNLLPGGISYSVQAHYEGDGNFAGSDSNSTTVTVNPEPSVTSARVVALDVSTGQVTNSNATAVSYGSLYFLRADVENSSGSGCASSTNTLVLYACPTGSVELSVDGTAAGPGPYPLNSQGSAENQSLVLTAGTHTITANYSGDNSYLASTGTASFSVTPAPTVLGLDSNFPFPIGPVTLNLFVRSANIGNFPTPPTGTFTIFDDSTQLPLTLGQPGTGVIYPKPNSPYVWVTYGGNLNFTLPGPSGPHTLTLNYSGDTNYAPSSSGPYPVTEVYPTTLQLTPSATTIVDGQPLTVTAQIVPSQNAGAAPSGNMTFNLYGNPFRTVPVVNGQAQITLTTLSPTTAVISAMYSGDSNYMDSSASFTETITYVSTSVSVTSSKPTVDTNTQVTFTAQLNPSSTGAAPAAGSVYFTANGIEIGYIPVANNQAQVTTSFMTPGSVQVQANYGGDANYAASTGTVTETVTAPPDFSFIVAPGQGTQTVTAGQTATFTNAISVNAVNGFTGQVAVSCTSPAQATTCSLNPNTLAAGQSATVMVTTTARSAAPPLPSNRRILSWPRLVPVVVALMLSFLLMRLARTRPRRVVAAFPVAGLLLFLVLQAIGCGGGSSYTTPPPPIGTPAGNYTITVTGVSTTPNTTHTATLQLIVN
jgi:hypothetical protein